MPLEKRMSEKPLALRRSRSDLINKNTERLFKRFLPYFEKNIAFIKSFFFRFFRTVLLKLFNIL